MKETGSMEKPKDRVLNVLLTAQYLKVSGTSPSFYRVSVSSLMVKSMLVSGPTENPKDKESRLGQMEGYTMGAGSRANLLERALKPMPIRLKRRAVGRTVASLCWVKWPKRSARNIWRQPHQ